MIGQRHGMPAAVGVYRVEGHMRFDAGVVDL
jgi:hypothetical protein